MQQTSERSQSIEGTPLRALLARKSLADARHRSAVARLLGVTDSEVLAIQHLAWAGALTPSRLGHQLRLTSGGTTALVQRLARLGYVEREAHPEDRRSTLLRLTERAEREAGALWAPLVQELDELGEDVGEEALAAATALLESVVAVAERHADALASSADAERPRIPRVPTPGLWA